MTRHTTRCRNSKVAAMAVPATAIARPPASQAGCFPLPGLTHGVVLVSSW